MVVKAKPPKESDAAVAARERAEASAEKRNVSEVKRGVTRETSALLRRFGIKAAFGGLPGAASGPGGTGGGSYDPAAMLGGFGGLDFAGINAGLGGGRPLASKF